VCGVFVTIRWPLVICGVVICFGFFQVEIRTTDFRVEHGNLKFGSQVQIREKSTRTNIARHR
jgi:hypothetical protein